MPVILRLVESAWAANAAVSSPASCAAQTFRLSHSGATKAEDLAAMFDAFADREDLRIGGTHIVVDHDAAIDVEPRGSGQVDVGADADGQHHQIGRDGTAVGQPHAFGALAA